MDRVLYWAELRNRLYLLAVLPGLFWTGPAVSINGVRTVPFTEDAAKGRVKLAAPGVNYRVRVASATTAPWVDANGWRFRREPSREFWSDVPAGSAAIAASEAYAYDAKMLLKIAPADLDAFKETIEFLRSIPERNLPEVADFGIIDDGSERAGEILNLLTRRNLLYKAVRTPDPKLRFTVPANADDPHLFAAKIRERLSDDQRSLRIYGSEVVLCRLLSNGTEARVHLLNYGRRPLEGVRLRVRGDFKHGKLYGRGSDKPFDDWQAADGFTEFSIPEIGTYAVVDLTR